MLILSDTCKQYIIQITSPDIILCRLCLFICVMRAVLNIIDSRQIKCRVLLGKSKKKSVSYIFGKVCIRTNKVDDP